MPTFFAALLHISLKASLVILVVLLLRMLLYKAPKKFSYALWALVAFRLLIPVSIPSAFSIFGVAKIADDTPFADLYAPTVVTTAPALTTDPSGSLPSITIKSSFRSATPWFFPARVNGSPSFRTASWAFLTGTEMS